MNDTKRLEQLRGIVIAIGAIDARGLSPEQRTKVAHEFQRAQLEYFRELTRISRVDR